MSQSYEQMYSQQGCRPIPTQRMIVSTTSLSPGERWIWHAPFEENNTGQMKKQFYCIAKSTEQNVWLSKQWQTLHLQLKLVSLWSFMWKIRHFKQCKRWKSSRFLTVNIQLRAKQTFIFNILSQTGNEGLILSKSLRYEAGCVAAVWHLPSPHLLLKT